MSFTVGKPTPKPATRDPSDIHQRDWVERWLPRWAEPYARLARWDRPIGTWLLLFPGWWGIALASPKWPDPLLLLLFAVGAVAMRGAGCTLNDLPTRVIGISADDPETAIEKEVRQIIAGLGRMVGADGDELADSVHVTADDSFVGEGYGLPTPASQEA